MSIEVTQEALTSVLQGMVNAHKTEREKSNPFKAMFQPGSSFTDLLREVKSTGMKGVLDASAVLKQRYGAYISHPVFEFLLATPFLAYKLQRHIENTDGASCSVDKTYFLLSEELKRLIEANPKPTA